MVGCCCSLFKKKSVNDAEGDSLQGGEVESSRCGTVVKGTTLVLLVVAAIAAAIYAYIDKNGLDRPFILYLIIFLGTFGFIGMMYGVGACRKDDGHPAPPSIRNAANRV